MGSFGQPRKKKKGKKEAIQIIRTDENKKFNINKYR